MSILQAVISEMQSFQCAAAEVGHNILHSMHITTTNLYKLIDRVKV